VQPVLSDDALELHLVALAQVHAMAQDATASLPEPDLAALARRYQPGRRQLAEASMLLARAVTGRATGRPPDTVQVVADAWGCPLLGDRLDRLHFNVSHDSGLLALVLGSGACGVDVEDAAEDSLREVASRYCGPGDLALLAEPDGARLLWTAKESAAKALRRGLRAGLSSIHLVGHPGKRWARVAWRGDLVPLRTRTANLGIRHLSITASAAPATIQVRLWEPWCAGGRWSLRLAGQPCSAIAAVATELDRQFGIPGGEDR
jgi:phosphopantetheinyl transferase